MKKRQNRKKQRHRSRTESSLFIMTKATRMRKRTIKRIVTENGIVELSIPQVGLSRSRSR